MWPRFVCNLRQKIPSDVGTEVEFEIDGVPDQGA
jgi:hypothetical protein